tara:strand:+ start:283 stop:1350 length:1068 start_codon:yes stop_codon:yes gene_type:complete
MLYSASWNESYIRSGGLTESLFLKNHLKRISIGFLCLFAALIFDYRNLKPIASYLLAVSLILLIITKGYYLINGIKSPARWLNLGFFSFQTSDIARLSLIIFLSYYLDQIKTRIKNLYDGFLPCITAIGIMMAFIVIQPDFSTAFMVGLIGILLLFISGARIFHILISFFTGLLISFPIIYFSTYRWARIRSFFNPDIKSDGYQAYQAELSMSNGGWFGSGLGNSTEKNHLLPTPHTDFIFSIIGEELGFLLGTLPLLLVFLFIFFRGIQIAKKCTDPFGIFLAMGICINIVLYAFVNAAVATGLFPVTGLPMPLISYGGSGMLINMVMIGILLNISQAKRSIRNTKSWSILNFG